MDKQKTIDQSKAEYGTMTAKFDANNDYSKATSAAGQTSKKQSSQAADLSNQTLTAKKDANQDYTS